MSKRLRFVDIKNRETIFPMSIAEIDIPDEVKELNHVGGFYDLELLEDEEVFDKKFEKGTKYEGVYFGPFGYHARHGNYWHSSRNKYFRKIFHGRKPLLKYTISKVCDNGTTMENMYNTENKNLVKNKAASSDMYWNGNNGFKQYDEPDVKLIQKVAKLIQKAIDNYMEIPRKPLGVDGMYIKSYPLNTIQPKKPEDAKTNKEQFLVNQAKYETDGDDVEDIRNRVDEYGMELVDPSVVWKNAEALDIHWICNGHTTLKGLKLAKYVDWDIDSKEVLMVTDEVYQNLTKDDCKTVNCILNAPVVENDRVGGKTNWKTGKKKLVDLYTFYGWTEQLRKYDSTYNSILKAFKLTSNDKEKAIAAAINDIEAIKRGEKSAASTKIDYSLNEEQENIVLFIESLYKKYPKDKSIFVLILTKAMNGNFNRVFDAIDNAKNSKRFELIDNYNIKGKISKKEPKIWKFLDDPNLKPKNIENIVILPDFRKDETSKQVYTEGKWNVKERKIIGPGHWINFKNRLLTGGILHSFVNYQNKENTLFKELKILDQKDIVSIPLPEYREDTKV